MSSDIQWYALTCRACGARREVAQGEIVRMLRAVGMFRREAAKDDLLVEELISSSGGLLTCLDCGGQGLSITPADDPWVETAMCEICRKPIDPERLEALPGAKRCAECQGKAERGQAVEVEYCPKCGSPLVIRAARRGGTTQYKQFCTGSPPCRL